MNNVIKGHSAMIVAELLWGVSAPVGTLILAGGVAPMVLTDSRVLGAALLFWILSFFTKKEEVSPRDFILMFFASLLGIVINQSCFVWGLGITSPINASIITTSLPILTLVLAAIILKEPITSKKAGGVFLGAIGALTLIIGGNSHSISGDTWVGDVLVLTAQLSFTLYLVLFKHLIGRYSPITLMKWMFTYSSICLIPFTYYEWVEFRNSDIDPMIIWGMVFFVVGPTFLSYLLLPVGQKYLRPTVTAMYNYVQPVVATLISVLAGLGVFSISTAIAIILIFSGVFLVTQSKSRAEMEKDKNRK